MKKRIFFLCLSLILLFGTSATLAVETTVWFAAFGDYGSNDSNEQAVADMVHVWRDEAEALGIEFRIFTTGDNTYTADGTRFDVDVEPYYGEDVDAGIFCPAPGNHDYHPGNLNAYVAYFSQSSCLSGNGRYYDHRVGNVHFIVKDSNSKSVGNQDGNKIGGVQDGWFLEKIAEEACWKFVFNHHPIVTDGKHFAAQFKRDIYERDGIGENIDVLYSAHNHNYERWDTPMGMVQIVTGGGGKGLNEFRTRTDPLGYIDSAEYNLMHFATLTKVTGNSVLVETFTITGEKIDSWSKTKSCGSGPTATNTPTSSPSATATQTPSSTQTASQTPTATSTPSVTPTPGSTSTASQTPTATLAPTATSTSPMPTPTILMPIIFSDGFESGDLSAWSVAVTGGDLGVTAGAALQGTYGMRAVIDDTNKMYVQDETPDAEISYQASFYFDPNGMTITGSHNLHALFDGSTSITRLIIRYSGGYQLKIWVLGSSWVSGDWFDISDNVHLIEIDWQSASDVTASDGHLSFWIDDVLQETLPGISNGDYVVDAARLGPYCCIDAGTEGVYFFDEYVSEQ